MANSDCCERHTPPIPPPLLTHDSSTRNYSAPHRTPGPGIDHAPSTPTVVSVVFFFFAHFCFTASGQAVDTGVVPFPPPFLPSIFVARKVQHSQCSSIFHRVLLTHALALSASQFVNKKKSPRIFTSMHSGGFELTKLTYTRLEDNLIRHRGDRSI